MVKFKDDFEGKGAVFGRFQYSRGDGTFETGTRKSADVIQI
jgi:hypothetical protein